MLKRTFNPDLLNAVANNAAVRPWLKGEGPINLTPLIANDANFALVNDDGGFLLTANGLADYEVHTLFPPGAIDPDAAARDCAEWMFCRTDAMRIVTKCPHDNPRARAFAEKAGMTLLFAMPDWACLALCIDAWAMGLDDDPREAARKAVDYMVDAGAPMKASAWLTRWAAWAGPAVPASAEAA